MTRAQDSTGRDSQDQPEKVGRFDHVAQAVTFILPPAIAIIIVIVLNNTNPTTFGVGGILLVFGLVYLLFLSVFFALLRSLSAITKRLGLPAIIFSQRKSYYLASVIAMLPVFLLALHSINQLRLVDVLLVCAFCAVAGFYVLRRTK